MATKPTRKAKPKPAARAARPAVKSAHKKKVTRKVARKAPVKHSVKGKAASALRSGDHFMRYSGKFTVRLPKSLHQALVERAEREGVSLNLFVTNSLSRTVAMPSGKSRR